MHDLKLTSLKLIFHSSCGHLKDITMRQLKNGNVVVNVIISTFLLKHTFKTVPLQINVILGFKAAIIRIFVLNAFSDKCEKRQNFEFLFIYGSW